MRFFLPNSFSRGRDVNWLVWVSSSATSSSKLSRKSGLFEKNKIKRTKKNKSRERHEGKKGKGEGEDGRKVVLECCDFENLTDQTHQLTTAEKRSLQQIMSKRCLAVVMVVVKWSASSPSLQMIRVHIPQKLAVFICIICFWKEENKQKEAGRCLPI